MAGNVHFPQNRYLYRAKYMVIFLESTPRIVLRVLKESIQSRKLHLLTSTDGEEINLKYFSEDISSNPVAYVKVMSTSVIAPRSYSFIEGKIRDISSAQGNPLLVERMDDQNFNTTDIIVNGLTSKRLSIPIFNNTDETLCQERHRNRYRLVSNVHTQHYRAVIVPHEKSI